MQALPILSRLSDNPLTKEEIEFLQKIESFKFSDDEKLDMLTCLAQNILREEVSITEHTKKYLDDGYSDNESKLNAERRRKDRRLDDALYKIPLNYNGDRWDFIESRKKDDEKRSKGQAIILVIFIIVAGFILAF